MIKDACKTAYTLGIKAVTQLTGLYTTDWNKTTTISNLAMPLIAQQTCLGRK